MWLNFSEFIREVKRALRDQAKFKPCRTIGEEVFFDNVPDGIYNLVIDGKKEALEVRNGMFNCNYTDVFVGKHVTVINERKPRKKVKHEKEETCDSSNE